MSECLQRSGYLFDRLRAHLNDFVEKISKTELKGRELEKHLDELRLSLAQNDVAFVVAERICNETKSKIEGVTFQRFADPRSRLREIIRDILLKELERSGGQHFFEVLEEKRKIREPAVIVFVGINGTGKTTSIAKIAKMLTDKGYSTVLACADTYRTGAIEQLEEHARRVGVRTIKQRYGADAAATAFDTINYAKANGINTVLIDTAGRMQTNLNLIEEMKKIVRVSKADLVILVVDALTGNDAVEQGRVFASAVEIDGIILTKLDADAKGGSAISITNATGKPIFFAGVGQGYRDLISFEPREIVSKIID